MIHIIHNGQTLCGEFWPVLSEKYPADRWTGIDNREHATCPVCLKNYDKLPAEFWRKLALR